MKLATLNDGTRDGALVVVSRDLGKMAEARDIAPSLQAALDQWHEIEPRLRSRFLDLQAGRVAGAAFDPARAMAPLPRAWQWLDGSAFESHGDLMSTVFGLERLSYAERPLMYQGMSHQFLAAHEDVPLSSEADGIDFEGEYAVLTDAVGMGASVDEAATHIRLIGLINDWSLRALAPVEMKTGFGWIQAKPACSMAPVVATPDELGHAWRDGRVALPLEVSWNDRPFGRPNGAAMTFSFPQLVAHAARTRKLCAGTIVGSGTVSNHNYLEVGSTCIAERRAIEMLEQGAAQTGFMKFSDRVRMQVEGEDGTSLFGKIDQRVVPSDAIELVRIGRL